MRTPRSSKIYPNQTQTQTQHPGTCHKDHLSFIPHFPPPPFWKKPMSNELFLSLLKRCVSTKTLQQIHTQTLINSVNISTSLLSKLIHLKDFNYASLLFSHLPQPNDYAFNIIIRAFTTTWQKYNLTLKSYYQMKSLGLKPDNFTYPFVFIACANLLALDHGQVAHSMVFKNGLNAHGHVSHSLISMYARCRELGYARKVFDEIRDRDLVSWNSIISGYSKMGFAADAVTMFGKMRDEGFEPNEMTIVSVLGACGDLGDLSLGRWAEGFVVSIDMKMNSYIGSALIGMYSKCGDLSSARRVFDCMKNKDVVTWNAMITGYAQNGLSDEAMMLFNSMKVVGIHPDKITLVGMLSASASIGALDFGKSIDAYASERGFQHDIYVGTALVDMYAKCGSMGHALRVFEGMPQKNEVTWNAMISALAFHGQAQEALLLFKCMSEEHVASCPNDITFVAVLSACVHAGFVDEGHRLFSMMKSYYGLVPKIEHYSCMVDLLARAGRVYEAWDFIEKMPEKPDEVILGALLGACQKLRNVHIGEKVIQLLLEMEPSNSGNYVISSKIYANLKKWDDSARMRVLMRQKGVTKTPGCSWIETEAQVHEFLSGSSFYLYSEQIHEVLELLYDDMKMRGYWPNVNLL